MIKKNKLQDFYFLIQKVEQFFDENCFTALYGFARSIIALGLLLTFLTNKTEFLFDKHIFDYNQENALIPINLFFSLGWENIWFAEILCILILAFVVMGFYPFITGLLHWWVTFSFNEASAIVDGGEQIAVVLTLLLIPVTLLDNRRNHFFLPNLVIPSWKKNIGNSIIKILIPMQMSILYLHAAVEKVYKVEEWRNGTAVYYFSNDPIFGSALLSNISETILVIPMTWSAMLLELVLAGCIFMSYSNRKYFFYVAFLFHLVIAFNFGLVSFLTSMLGGLIIYLLKPINYEHNQL